MQEFTHSVHDVFPTPQKLEALAQATKAYEKMSLSERRDNRSNYTPEQLLAMKAYKDMCDIGTPIDGGKRYTTHKQRKHKSRKPRKGRKSQKRRRS